MPDKPDIRSRRAQEADQQRVLAAQYRVMAASSLDPMAHSLAMQFAAEAERLARRFGLAEA